MSDIPCIACALAGEACCLNRQIVLTKGDMDRISGHVRHRDFFALEKPDPWYLEPFYDPDWLNLVIRPDGYLRVLKRNENAECTLLTKTGCMLPFFARPLVCQLHPYMYTENGILGIDESCPISREKDGYACLERLDMPLDKAIGWRLKLYDELNQERYGHVCS